jgi:hypothetical protein
MTPKEKAVELIYKYWNIKVETIHVKESIISKELAIKCALIAVDEILNTRPGSPYPQDVGLVVNGVYNIINYPDKYWQEVKQEILKF